MHKIIGSVRDKMQILESIIFYRLVIQVLGPFPFFSFIETLYHRDDALLYIAYVMLIWAAPIPADRWHCSLWP